MKTQMPRTIFAWLAVGVGIGSLVSCSAAKDMQKVPVENAPRRHRTVPAGSGSEVPSLSMATATASASTKPTTCPQDVLALPCGAHPLHSLDPPRHALSQKVPDRVCSDDRECGDGFCDRGRCAPIWDEWYGLRCTEACECGPFLCLEGRCRSCLRHADCAGNRAAKLCSSDGLYTSVPIANACGALGMHETRLPSEPVRPPPPTPP